MDGIFAAIQTGLKKLWSIIVHTKARAAIAKTIELVPLALPIVQDLRQLDPHTAAWEDVEKMYAQHSVPLFQAAASDPQGIGNALLNLATFMIRRRAPAFSTSAIHTAIQLALTALKAK